MKWLQQEGVDFKPFGPNNRGTYYTQMFQVHDVFLCFFLLHVRCDQ